MTEWEIFDFAVEQAEKNGLIVCCAGDNDNLDGVLMETSGSCITPSRLPYINSTSYKFPDDKVYHYGLARDIAAMEKRNIYQSNFSKYLKGIIEKGEKDDISLFKIIEEYTKNDKKLEEILKKDAIFDIMHYALITIASNINVKEEVISAMDINTRTTLILDRIGTYTDDLYRSCGEASVTIKEMKDFIADVASEYVFAEDYYSKLPNNTESDNTQKARKIK